MYLFKVTGLIISLLHVSVFFPCFTLMFIILFLKNNFRNDKTFYYIHFEITGYPCNVIGSQWCDLFPNRSIFCSKSHLFSRPMRMAQKNKTAN